MKIFNVRASIRNAAVVFVLMAAVWAQPWKLLAQNTPAAAPQPADRHQIRRDQSG